MMCEDTYICMYTYNMYIYIYVYDCTYIHIYIYIHTILSAAPLASVTAPLPTWQTPARIFMVVGDGTFRNSRGFTTWRYDKQNWWYEMPLKTYPITNQYKMPLNYHVQQLC